MRGFDRDLIRGGHYGQRSCEPHKQAEHMAAPTKPAGVKKVLANSEPSTHGTFQSTAMTRGGRLAGGNRTSRGYRRRTDLIATQSSGEGHPIMPHPHLGDRTRGNSLIYLEQFRSV